MRETLQPAYVLHRRAYRESSLLVEALTLEHGRVGLVARGARRPRSALRGLLEPFRPVLLSFQGARELMTLTSAESAPGSPGLAAGALISGFYLNELLMRLLQRNDPHPELFRDYADTLQRLSDPRAPVEALLRVFEKRLLESTGYALALDAEADGGRALTADRRYRYEPQRGAVPASSGAGAGVTVSGRTLLALAQERLEDPQVLAEAKALMRLVINELLGGRPLASRALFR